MISPVMPTYGERTLAFVKGEGAYLYDESGRRYLDFAAGIAVNALGHCHPHLVKALQDQAATLWHTSNLYRIPGQEKLAARLVANSFADTVFFCNSGVEAMEAALKMARRHQWNVGQPERYRMLCVENAFHGRSLATISAAGQKKLVEGFGPMVEGFDRVAYDNLNEARAAVTAETAAVVVEPVQGEGGARPASLSYLRGLRDMADEFGLLLVFDEIQTGNGRTGKLFAHEWTGIAPDVMATAKGLGGGFPVGAVLATEQAAAGMAAGTHGTTFGGNPLAMAAANAVYDILLSEGFLDGVDKIARHLWRELEALVRRHPAIFVEVRGAGLLLGLKTRVPNLEVIKALQSEGLLTVGAADNVVRLLPPLIIDENHVAEALEVLDRVATSWKLDEVANG